MSFLSSQQQSDAKRYKGSSEDLSYQGLKIAKWYIRNKTKLANIGIGTLLTFCIITVGYSLVMWIGYIAIGMDNDTRLAEASALQFQDYTQLRSTFTPNALVIGATRSFVENSEYRSVFTEVRNPNDDWVAIIAYQFGLGETKQARLLPGERNLLVDLGSLNEGRAPDLRINSVSWERLDRHTYANPANFIGARLNFQLTDVQIDPFDSVNQTPTQVRFIVENMTAYGYWEATFFAALYSGDQIIAVRPVLLRQFESGEVREVSFNFGNERLGITDVELLPTINVFDEDIYLPASNNS